MRMHGCDWLAVAVMAGCSAGSGSDSSDDGDSGVADESVRDTDGALDAPDATDLVVDLVDAGDAPEVQFCPGARGECGWRCCTGDVGTDPAYWDCMDPWVEWYFRDTNFVFLGAQRVTPEIVAGLPPVTGWTWRADGTELAVLGDLSSCRWGLECQDWCWHVVGPTLFVVDIPSDTQIHSEPLDCTPRYPDDWPYVLRDQRFSPSFPLCPGTEDPPTFPGQCYWTELPEREVAYAFRAIPFYHPVNDDLQRRLGDLPLIDDAIEIYPIDVEVAYREVRVGTIDLTVPRMRCGPRDPGCGVAGE